MEHRTSSEASNLTCSRISPGSSVSDVSQQTMCGRRQRGSDLCPGSQPDNPERIYVLRNCDRCPDYTVSPCQENQCPGRCTNFSGECPSCSFNCPAAYPPQERLSGEKAKPTKSKPPKPPPPEGKQRSKRRSGGTNQICPLCGQMEISAPGQTMCSHCNERIHSVVNNYLQCHCYPTGQEANSAPLPPKQNEQPGNGQQVQVLKGDPNLNVIVLQDCQNKQELFDQLAKAMNRNGGQVQNPQPSPYCQGSGYNQNNANNSSPSNRQSFQTNRNSYQANPLTGYSDQGTGYNQSNANNNNNPLPGYNDYSNYNKGFEMPEAYDYRYDMGPGRGSTSYPEAFADNRYNEYPMREAQDPYPEPYDNDFHGQKMDQERDGDCLCTCNCGFCRKGFETKEKLSQLLAQALEIFVQGYQEKERKNKKPKRKKRKKKAKNEKRKSAGSTETMPWEDSPLRDSPNQSRSWRTSPGKPSYRPYYPGKRARPQMHGLSQAQKHVSYPTGRMTTNSSTADANSQANLRSFCSKHQSPKDPSLPSESFKADGSKRRDSRPPTFYLPNCEDLRSSLDSGSVSRFDSSGGDSRRRRRARRRARYILRQQQQAGECNQGNQRVGEDRRWPGGGNDRKSRGGNTPSVLLGLSPIAHYRPGMMKFPVNYLLAGTNYRRRLVRTAAGVTLHQKPYMDKAEVKDLPHFPRQASSHLDCRMPPAKKWL